MSDETTELQSILDEFEHECFMLRVEASETRARDDVVRKSYERIRDGFAGRIATTLGNEHAIHGTLTAEQVREAIEANSWAETSTIREFNDSSWQTIADELNAALESETCENADKVQRAVKLCPWCGSEANLVEMKTKCDGMTFWKVSCNDCRCMGANIHMWHKTESEAIEAWNTRATLGGEGCEQVLVDCIDGLLPPFKAYCSKCGAEWRSTPKFCPECGEKVTGTRDERKAVKQ